MSIINADLHREINRLTTDGGYLDLFTLDATNIGGSLTRFTNYQTPTGGNVVFGGATYTALPIVAQGFDITSSGTLPNPTITVANVDRTLLSAVITLGDIVGAPVERRITHTKFLDTATFSTRWNLLDDSEAIGTNTWLKVRAGTTSNIAMAPDGTYTADRLAETGTTAPGSPYFYATQTRPATATTLTFSTYVKAQQRTFANIRFDDGAGTNTCTVSVNLTTGELGTIDRAGTTSNATARADDVGNGWWRVSMTCTWTTITNCRVFIRPSLSLGTDAAALGYTPDTSQGLLFWGCQLVEADSPLAYQPTGAGSGATSTAYGSPAFISQPYANASAFRLDKWVINQKTEHTKHSITWSLATSLDRLGLKFGRQVLKDQSARNLYAPGAGRTRVR